MSEPFTPREEAMLNAILAHLNVEDELTVRRCWDSARRAALAMPSEAPDALVAEMLAALQGVVKVADRATVEFDRARAAIAKATGA